MLITDEDKDKIFALLQEIEKESKKLPTKFLQNEALYLLRCGEFAKVFFESFLYTQNISLFTKTAYELLIAMCITNMIKYEKIKDIKKTNRTHNYNDIKDAMCKMIINEIYSRDYDFLSISLIIFLYNEDAKFTEKLAADLHLFQLEIEHRNNV